MLKVEKWTKQLKVLKEKNIKVMKLLSSTKMVKAVRVEGDAKVTFPVDKEVDGAYFVTSDTKEVKEKLNSLTEKTKSLHLTLNTSVYTQLHSKLLLVKHQ